MAGTGSTLFSAGLFWRQLRFGRKLRHIIFQWSVLEARHIWRELAPYYFPADCFGGSSDLAGTSSTLYSGGLFWRRTTVLYTKYVLNSLTAIDGHDRQYFNELRSTVVSRRIFIRSQSLIAR